MAGPYNLPPISFPWPPGSRPLGAPRLTALAPRPASLSTQASRSGSQGEIDHQRQLAYAGAGQSQRLFRPSLGRNAQLDSRDGLQTLQGAHHALDFLRYIPDQVHPHRYSRPLPALADGQQPFQPGLGRPLWRRKPPGKGRIARSSAGVRGNRLTGLVINAPIGSLHLHVAGGVKPRLPAAFSQGERRSKPCRAASSLTLAPTGYSRTPARPGRPGASPGACARRIPRIRPPPHRA